MGKDSKKQTKGRGVPLDTHLQSKAYVQQVEKESKILMADTNAQLDRLQQKSQDKNYLTIFTKSKEPQFIKTSHPLESQEETEYHYDQKAARDRHYNPRRRAEQTKDLYVAPLTSNQNYGWRPPIDTFVTNFGMKSTLGEQTSKPAEKSNKK